MTTSKLAFVMIPLLIAAALIAMPTTHQSFAQTTTTTGGTTTTTTVAHHFRGGFFRGGGLGLGLGLGAGVILNPEVNTGVVCPAYAPVPVSNGLGGVNCLSAANAGADVFAGSIVTPTSPIIIGGTTFGGGFGFGFHHFGFHHH